MGRKPGKFLCCMSLLTILRVDPAQNLAKYKRWLRVRDQLKNLFFMSLFIQRYCYKKLSSTCEEFKFRGWYDAAFRLGQETHQILSDIVFVKSGCEVRVPLFVFPVLRGTTFICTLTFSSPRFTI